ncbi:MAG: ABC transporter substrate-binding protein [Limnochordia bacterium]|jgi:branched-chain amino acid transport system substrate-binding protein
MKATFRVIAWSLLLVFALTAFAAANDNVIRIGVLAATTGPNATYGRSLNSGAQLAVEEINAAGGVAGYTFELVSEDSQHEPAAATTAAQRMIYGHKVDVILGDAASTNVFAIEPLVQREGIINIAMGSATRLTQRENPNPWLVRVREYDLLTARVMVNYLVDILGIEKIGILHMTEQFGVGGRDDIVASLAERGMKPVAIEAHNPGDRDLTGQLLNMRRAGVEAIVSFSAVPEMALLCRQARQLIPNAKLVLSSVGATKGFLDIAGEHANGALSVAAYSEHNDDPKVQEFISNFEKRYGERPFDFFVALAYDSVYLLAEAVEKAGTNDRKAIRAAFDQIQGYPGATGLSYYLTPDGQALHELFVVEIQDAKPIVLEKVQG